MKRSWKKYEPEIRQPIRRGRRSSDRMSLKIEELIRNHPVGMTSEELADILYSEDPSGGPDWSLVVMRVTINRMRDRGMPITNKPHTEASTHSGRGKTGRGTKALYSLPCV